MALPARPVAPARNTTLPARVFIDCFESNKERDESSGLGRCSTEPNLDIESSIPDDMSNIYFAGRQAMIEKPSW